MLIKTKEAIEVLRDAEIDWAVDPGKTKSLLRRLGGVNKPTWWRGETTRGWVFQRSELKDLAERHPIPSEADPVPAGEKA
jgi:hypothetical protein